MRVKQITQPKNYGEIVKFLYMSTKFVIFSILTMILLSSCSHYINTTYCIVDKDTLLIKNNYPKIVFEGKYNRKVKIYINDSLYFSDKIKNYNFNVLIHAKTIILDRFPNTIDLKVGLRLKKHIIWNGRYKYIVICETNKFSHLKCYMMTKSRGYR